MTTNTPEIQSLIRATGSFQVTGSINVTGSITAKFDAPYTAGTASFIGLVSSASFTHTYEIINNNGSYTWYKQPWAKWITVIAIGGGGGGGGSYTPFVGTTTPNATGGAGGSGGSVVMSKFKATDISNSVTVFVGAGGNGGTGAGNPGKGGNASNSSFGNYIIAYGGNGGIGATRGAGNDTITAWTLGLPSIDPDGFGGGWGGRGIVISNATRTGDAPPLPMRDTPTGVTQTPIPWPSAITTTGGGGGAGMNCDAGANCISYTVRGNGGKIDGGGLNTNGVFIPGLVNNAFQKPTYDNVPAYNTLVGLGGRGGDINNDAEDGGKYGGGGGGARSQPQLYLPGYTGGKGANGIVIVITET